MTSTPFEKFVSDYTKPFPEHACPACGTWGLRRYVERGKPERVICLNQRCSDYERVPGMP